MWELDHKEGRATKNWCLQTVVLEKTPESPLNSKEIKLVNLKGYQPWIFTRKTDAEAPVFWPSDENGYSLEKSLTLGKTVGRRRRGHQRMRWLGGITNAIWTWTWANSRRRWGTGRPGMLQSMGLQRARHDWATEQQQHEIVQVKYYKNTCMG